MQAVRTDVIPSQESNAADDNQQRDRNGDHRVVRVIHKRRKGLLDPHQVESRIAKGGNRVKQGIPKSLYQAEFLPENGEQRGSPQQLYHQGSFQDKTCQAHDPAHIRRSDGLLHRAALHQADPAPGEDTESTGHGYHPKAPDLDKQYDDELSEIRPVSSSVVNNQACHAYRRRGSKQSIRKRRDNTFFCGNRKHQQEAPQQNHQEKSEYDDPKRRRPAFMKRPLRKPHPLICLYGVLITLSTFRLKGALIFKGSY